MELTLGHVFKRTAEIVRANIGLLAIVTGVLLLPTSVANAVISRLNNPQVLAEGGVKMIFGYVGLSFLNAFVAVALYGLIQAVAMTIAVDSMSGAQPTLGAALRKAFGHFWPVILTVILQTVAWMAGFMLCIVPGLILIAALALAVPVAVTEDVSAAESLRRSWGLSKGRRKLIFVAFVAFGMLMFPVQIGLQFAFLGNPFRDPQAIFNVPLGTWIAHQLLSYVVGVCFIAVASVLTAVLYIEIKNEKEGVDVQSLAAVFT